MTRRKVSPEVNAISTIIFVVVLVVLLIVNIYEARHENIKAQRRNGGGAVAEA
jgi:spermidine/putrescine transport system permease protein